MQCINIKDSLKQIVCHPILSLHCFSFEQINQITVPKGHEI